MKTRMPIFLAILFTIVPAILFLTACDEDSPAAPKDEAPIGPVASSPESLLTAVFENAYNNQDSTAYAAMLDTLYEFELLPNDPGDSLNVETWDYETELSIAGHMFSGWTNGNGVKVLSINLAIVMLVVTESVEDFPDQPEGETWHKAATEVDLVVVTQDPSVNDGSGILNRVVFSRQDFVVKPDPDDLDLWVIRKQVDREPINKRGTEQSNWGAIKSLFLVEEPEPETSTPGRLLRVAFQNTYNGRDSTTYETLLDSLYEFELLPDSVDAQSGEAWDLAEELQIAGRMFNGWTSQEGIKVMDIQLRFIYLGKTVCTDFFQDQPEGEIWYKMDTEISLKVVTQDPSAYDGNGIINRVVHSGQDFIVKPDPGDSELWVIRKQIDKDPIGKEGTEKASWGAIKSLFQ